MIGKLYRYPLCEKVFKLTKIKYTPLGDPMSFYFECGHWCTDGVFDDLIDIETGKQNYIGKQLKLF